MLARDLSHMFGSFLTDQSGNPHGLIRLTHYGILVGNAAA
jgi:hypothetical protein